MINVRDKIEEIVLSIKSTGNVDSWLDNTGSYTITTASTGNLAVGFKVVLIYADTSLNRDEIITSVTDTTFTFSGSGITEPVSWRMAIYFEEGHRIELNQKYGNKLKSTPRRVSEYPLFWLYTDFQEELGDGETTAFETELGFSIVNISDIDLMEDERMEQKFKPVLYPYKELIESAFNTAPYKRNFVTPWGEENTIKFKKTDRPFFGSADKEKSVLPQITDAIEFQVNLRWFVESTSCA